MTDAQSKTPLYKQYHRSQIAELADWMPGFDMSGVSISDADKAAGSPKLGDKIARNPANHADRWLVAADYFAVNFEPALRATREEGEWQWVPKEPTREMLNAAIDVHGHKLCEISRLGIRQSPQWMFEQSFKAMLSATPQPQGVPGWARKNKAGDIVQVLTEGPEDWGILVKHEYDKGRVVPAIITITERRDG